ncbi:SLC13 family permease [Zobellia galactanivorans]|uniref:SLC13 family permease n=1 Tax=Zobellia galactanivorans (strain DSM 12802 / CCUG 47099 / CIP 106680 / NCIMB 13871 / Dsij) TaxID=63186 RepID=UPI001C072ACD|nr:SLC13 family permease [Zobellia galactanivorans]MBU3028377.1 SLC13 family permease [Zobellia galactanivorans]
MTWEITLMFCVLLVTVILFVFEVFPVDKIAFLIIVSLTLLGLVKPEEAISGFSNSATIAVLALMILAIALEENGVINWLASGMGRIKGFPLYVMAPLFMFVTAGISAFISTTAVVIVFIKIVNQLSEKYNVPQSKLLLPISFAGILGGSCTLMGTSTNLIVNSVATDLGAEKLGFFEFSLLGSIFLIISMVYLTLTLHWLPWGKTKNIDEDYNLDNYVTHVHINADSQLVGKTVQESFLFENPDVTLLKLTRNHRVHNSPGKYITFKAGDELLLMCDLENLSRINASENLSLNEKQHITASTFDEIGPKEAQEKEGELEARVFVELLMLPGAQFLGKTLGVLRSSMIQDIIPIAIKKRKTLTNLKERLVRSSMNKLVLKVGDRLLLETSREKLETLSTMENVLLLEEFDSVRSSSKFKRYFSLAVLLLVIGLAASGILSIMVSALTGVCILLLTKNLDLSTVYKKVNWQIFFLLAGMIPLGTAMHNTGADVFISEELLKFLFDQPGYVVIGTLFFSTMILSAVISNNATAIIMTPISIAVAQGMQYDFKPFILAVMFAANFSFFTPVGYQTNTLIYSLGNYRFSHFLIIGGLLSLILAVVASLLLTNML